MRPVGRRNRRGFLTLVLLGGVTLVVAGLAGTAAVVTVMEQNAQTQETWRKLESDYAGDYESVTDQQVTQLREGLATQLQTATLYANLGTAGAPGGDDWADAAGRAIMEVVVYGDGIPRYVGSMTDPTVAASTEGTEPTGGKAPPEPDVEPPDGLLSVTITFRNLDDSTPNDTHLMLKGQDFSFANSLLPGNSRTETFGAAIGDDLVFVAGRQGRVMGRTHCPVLVRERFEVIWDNRGRFYCL